MLFSSYVFVFAFLPLTLFFYYLIGRFISSDAPQKLLIIIASLFFYGWFDPKYVFILAASVAVNYLSGLMMSKTRLRKTALAVGVAFNVALLGWFKYRDFFVENLNAVFRSDLPLRHILLPLGISFFTFQQLSFLVGSYRNGRKCPAALDYVFFVTFFPQLIAGPIVAFDDVSSQLAKLPHRPVADGIAKGIFAFSVGLFKKLVIADTLSVFADNVFSMSDRPAFLHAFAGVLSYTFQIYFDFSGYSDMAVGLGRMFGFTLPCNFDLPYLSSSVTEFWRRWHITLGRSLMTLVYVPLGGNRKGKARTCLNLFITFLVSGFWHGASWTFVVWGILHGAAVCFERVFDLKMPKKAGNVLTFVFVSLVWVLFRAESFSSALNVWSGLVNFRDFGLRSFASVAADGIIGLPWIISLAVVAFVIVAAFCLSFLSKRSLYERCRSLSFNKKNAAVAALAFVAALVCMSRSQVFIYFNF